MSTIVISGYYGFGNLGDELILSAILRQLKKLNPKIITIVLSHNPERTTREHGVRAIGRWNPFSVGWALMRSSLLISGGGGLIQDKTSWRTPLYYLGVMGMALILGKPVVGWGQGVGPVVHPINRWLTRVIIIRLSFIMVRDPASYDTLLELGVSKDKVLLGADLVFTLAPQARATAKKRKKGPLAIILRNDLSPQAEIVLCDFLEQARRLTKLPLVFLSFQDEFDFSVTQRVRSALPFKTEVALPRLDTEVMLGFFTRAELVLSMRFHALILSAMAGTPSLGLSSSPKIDAFLANFGQISLVGSDVLVKDDAVEQLARVWKKRGVFQEHLAKGLIQSRKRLKTAENRLSVMIKSIV